MILYEYPCNERIRALLRVEYLFERLFFFAKGTDVHHHQITVDTLFDLLELCDRTDLRGAVLQDLERHRASLANLREHPGVDTNALDTMLATIQEKTTDLAAQGRIGQEVRHPRWFVAGRHAFVLCMADQTRRNPPSGSEKMDRTVHAPV